MIVISIKILAPATARMGQRRLFGRRRAAEDDENGPTEEEVDLAAAETGEILVAGDACKGVSLAEARLRIFICDGASE
jgi:hypothetical protein